VGNTSDNVIAMRLLAARSRFDWSREALAYHSGLSWSAIAQIESGRRTNPRPDTLIALASALKISVGYLIGDDRTTASLLHHAAPYGSDEAFIAAVVPFVRQGVDRRESVLVVTSDDNVALLRGELGDAAGDVSFRGAAEWYGSPLFAVAAYRSYTNDRIEAGAVWIRIVGEPVRMPTREGDAEVWGTYESMFNLIFATAPLTVMCPYDERMCNASVLDVVEQTHPFLVHDGEPQANDRFVDPEEFVMRTAPERWRSAPANERSQPAPSFEKGGRGGS